MKNLIIILFATVLLYSCIDSDPNHNLKGEDKLENELHYVDKSIQEYQDTVYIPIYSDIYSHSRLNRVLLTSTLSIRSTSLTDTTFINEIKYFDTKGNMVKSFIDKTLVLKPMQSIDYVIDKDDDTGGSGANFLVTWGAKANTKPLFQAVMISTQGQHGLSFVVDGISLKNI